MVVQGKPFQPADGCRDHSGATTELALLLLGGETWVPTPTMGMPLSSGNSRAR